MTNKSKWYLILSSLLFALMTLFIKYVSPHIPACELLFFRFAGGAAGCFLVDRNCLRIHKGSSLTLFSRALSGTIATVAFFYAPYFIPISRLAALHFTYPVFEVIFSTVLTKERAEKSIYLSMPVSFIGIYLITNPSFSGFGTGDFLGLISGVFAGLAVLFIRKARVTNSATTIFFYFCLFGAISTGLPTLLQWITPSFLVSLLILIVVVSGGAGQVFMTYAYKSSGVGEGSIISLSTIVFINILGFTFLKETIALRLLMGELLVFASIFMIFLKKKEDKELFLE